MAWWGPAGSVGSGMVWIGGFRQARQCEDWKGVDWSGRLGAVGSGQLWSGVAGVAGLVRDRKVEAGQVGSGKGGLECFGKVWHGRRGLEGRVKVRFGMAGVER
jgi:hypothetical protein